MQGWTWRGAKLQKLLQARDLLVRRGGVADRQLHSPHELWRVRIERVVFTAYTSGTLHCSGGALPELPFLYRSLSEVLEVD